MNTQCLSISIVTYAPDNDMLAATIRSLQSAVAKTQLTVKLFVVDHSPLPHPSIAHNNVTVFDDIQLYWSGWYEIIRDPINPGFGLGHNRSLQLNSTFHLVLNPDVEVEYDSIECALAFMEQYPECGLLTPFAIWEDGQIQRLCKRYPSVFDLLLRGFAPRLLKQVFHERLDSYEMTDKLNNQDVLWDPPIVSGCFMLFRMAIFQQLQGFDPRFFLYFEDFDISLRTGKISRIAYVPQVRVVHHGGHASRKGWRHIWLFGRSMCKFFNIHGWHWW